MNDESDGALVRRTCSGEPRAFELWSGGTKRRSTNAALAHAARSRRSPGVTQTVFLKVYEHLGEYDPSYKFYSWIYRIALMNDQVPAAPETTAALDFETPDGAPGPEGACDRRQLGDGMAAGS